MSPAALVRVLRRFRGDDSGVSALEFAMVLPVMITLFIGGFELSQGIGAYRKMTATTRTVADLVTQAQAGGWSEAEMTAMLNASTQVMAPYSPSTLTIVVTQFIACTPAGVAVVDWSTDSNPSSLLKRLAKGAKVTTLPKNLCQTGASIVRADVSYDYTPPIGGEVVGKMTFGDSLYMSPRQVGTIIYPRK